MEFVSEKPLKPEEFYDKISRRESGSVIFHYAVVRELTGEKVTTGIHFERDGEIESELARISAEIKKRWNVEDTLLVRRLGTLQVGDIISLVAVSSARSKDAFEACQYGVERLKKMSTLKKKEVFL